MEHVLVVDTDKINNMLTKNGLLTDNTDAVLELIRSSYYFCERGIAENLDTVKQIIPYAVLRNGGGIYVLERLSKQTEKRLHGKLSIGVGGHINPDAEESADPIEYGLYKELHEEVEIATIDRVARLGIINNLSTPVSNYHIGVLYEIWTSGEVRVLETEKMRGGWQSLDEAAALTDRMEEWSQIALEYITGNM